MENYHPGTCEATDWGKRYGKNLSPQRYDDPEHVWHKAKAKNWGPWSCCGRAVNSEGCQTRVRTIPTSTSGIGVGAYVQFLINEKNRELVSGESRKNRLLSTGRIAKKATEGTSWVWAKDYDS